MCTAPEVSAGINLIYQNIPAVHQFHADAVIGGSFFLIGAEEEFCNRE